MQQQTGMYSVDDTVEIARLSQELGRQIEGIRRFGYAVGLQGIMEKMKGYPDVFSVILKEVVGQKYTEDDKYVSDRIKGYASEVNFQLDE